MTEWRAWYTDGRVFDSRSHAWRDIPLDGMLVLVVYYDEEDAHGRPKRKIFDHEDWYFHEPGTDLFGTVRGPVDEHLPRYPGAVFKRGKWTTEEEFIRAREEAYDSEAP